MIEKTALIALAIIASVLIIGPILSHDVAARKHSTKVSNGGAGGASVSSSSSDPCPTCGPGGGGSGVNGNNGQPVSSGGSVPVSG